jgi:hypothetical protein
MKRNYDPHMLNDQVKTALRPMSQEYFSLFSSDHGSPAFLLRPPGLSASP